MDCDETDWDDFTKMCPKCGGEVHSHFGDENYDGDYWLIYHCHKCGESYNESEWEDMEQCAQ